MGSLGTAGIARDCSIPGMQKAENCERYGIAGRSLKKAEDYKDMFGFEKKHTKGMKHFVRPQSAGSLYSASK